MPPLKTYHFKLIKNESIVVTIHCYGNEYIAKTILLDHVLEPDNWILIES